jgi:hypothetical protein
MYVHLAVDGCSCAEGKKIVAPLFLFMYIRNLVKYYRIAYGYR